MASIGKLAGGTTASVARAAGQVVASGKQLIQSMAAAAPKHVVLPIPGLVAAITTAATHLSVQSRPPTVAPRPSGSSASTQGMAIVSAMGLQELSKLTREAESRVNSIRSEVENLVRSLDRRGWSAGSVDNRWAATRSQLGQSGQQLNSTGSKLDYKARLAEQLNRPAPSTVLSAAGSLLGSLAAKTTSPTRKAPPPSSYAGNATKAGRGPTSTGASPTLVDTKSSSNPFLRAGYWGECTYWAWERYNQVTGNSAPFRGNGGRWADEAVKNPTWKVDTQPRVGTFVVIPPYKWPGGDAVGHVAYVESVQPDGTFTVSEMNRLGKHDGPNLTSGYPQSYLFYKGTPEDERKRVLSSIAFVYKLE